MNKHTSFEFSKKLWDNGCRLEHNNYMLRIDNQITYKQGKLVDGYGILIVEDKLIGNREFESYPAYDILWDICIKYSKEFFGEEEILSNTITSNKYISSVIFKMLQYNEPQEEIEDYIWLNCKFNPENKGE